MGYVSGQLFAYQFDFLYLYIIIMRLASIDSSWLKETERYKSMILLSLRFYVNNEGDILKVMSS